MICMNVAAQFRLHALIAAMLSMAVAMSAQAAEPPPANGTPGAEPAPVPVLETTAAAAAAPASTSARRPASDLRIIEDEQVRIEEVRVRGQPVRVTVHSKVQGGSSYEINVGRGGRDPSQDSGKAGQSAWRLFRF